MADGDRDKAKSQDDEKKSNLNEETYRNLLLEIVQRHDLTDNTEKLRNSKWVPFVDYKPIQKQDAEKVKLIKPSRGDPEGKESVVAEEEEALNFNHGAKVPKVGGKKLWEHLRKEFLQTELSQIHSISRPHDNGHSAGGATYALDQRQLADITNAVREAVREELQQTRVDRNVEYTSTATCTSPIPISQSGHPRQTDESCRCCWIDCTCKCHSRNLREQPGLYKARRNKRSKGHKGKGDKHKPEETMDSDHLKRNISDSGTDNTVIDSDPEVCKTPPNPYRDSDDSDHGRPKKGKKLPIPREQLPYYDTSKARKQNSIDHRTKVCKASPNLHRDSSSSDVDDSDRGNPKNGLRTVQRNMLDTDRNTSYSLNDLSSGSERKSVKKDDAGCKAKYMVSYDHGQFSDKEQVYDRARLDPHVSPLENNSPATVKEDPSFTGFSKEEETDIEKKNTCQFSAQTDSGAVPQVPIVNTSNVFEVAVENNLDEVCVEQPEANIQETWEMALNDVNESLMIKLLEDNILPEQKDVQLAFQLYRINELTVNTVDAICGKICAHIKNRCSNINSVCASYTSAKPEQVVFVAMADEEVQVDVNYAVKVCHPEGYSEEGTVVTYHEVRRQKPIAPEESKEITATIQKHSNDLFRKHSNIQIISGCSVKSRGFGTDKFGIAKQTCIVIYVNVKGVIPLHEEHLPQYLLIPDTGCFFSVDVREGGMRYFTNSKPNEYHQQLKMGCEITDGKSAGTLGAVFEQDGKTYCLTCAHVFIENQNFKDILKVTGMYNKEINSPACKIRVYQGDFEPNNEIGVIAKAVIKPGNNMEAGIDLAVIELTDQSRLPKEGSFPDGNMEHAGFTVDNPMIYSSGRVYDQKGFREQTRSHTEVVKYGSATGYTRGLFDVEGACVKRHDLDGQLQKLGCVLNNQLLVLSAGSPYVNPFAADGDSGSLLFAKHGGKWCDLRAVGVIEGGTTNKMTVVTPVWDIFSYLERSTEQGLMQYTAPSILRTDSGYISPDGLPPNLLDTSRREDDREQERSQEMARQIQESKTELKEINERLDNMQRAQQESILDLQKQQTEHIQEQISDMKRQQEQHMTDMNEKVQHQQEAISKNIDDKMSMMMAMMQNMMQNVKK